MEETLKICKNNVNGSGYCDMFGDYCVEGPCAYEELVEYALVVRCKGCANRGTGDCPMERDFPWISSDSDGFCHRGEEDDKS